MEEPRSLTQQAKFIRRKDLSPITRAKIGIIAYLFPRHGTVIRLSRQHHVCRNFVYRLRSEASSALEGLLKVCSDSVSTREENWESSVRSLLRFRLEGGCSIRATGDLMQHFALPYHSTGFVSETLHQIGGQLPSTIDWQGDTFMASDEIFILGRQPILVSVDTRSLTVLSAQIRSNLSKEHWQSHWSDLKQQGISLNGLTSDDGWVIRAARMEDLSEVPWQPDTFHAVSHRFGAIVSRLERLAHQAIEQEYKRETLYKETPRPSFKPKFALQWKTGRQQSGQAIELLENFRFLYHCILQQFNTFDQCGQVRKAETAETEVETALDLLQTLPIKGLEDEIMAIRKVLPELFNFLRRAHTIQEQLALQVEPESLPFWCMAWQYLKKANKSCKRPKYQAYAFQQAQNFLNLIEQHLGLNPEQFLQTKQSIFDQLDQIVQSSASVETFNSFLRPFLNDARDQITQQTLNLIVFYYNHHVFERGKRKGKSPMEILTGQKDEVHWIDKILKIVKMQPDN